MVNSESERETQYIKIKFRKGEQNRTREIDGHNDGNYIVLFVFIDDDKKGRERTW
jgi:hypothetical protein